MLRFLKFVNTLLTLWKNNNYLVRDIPTSSTAFQLYTTKLISGFVISLVTSNTLFLMTLPTSVGLPGQKRNMTFSPRIVGSSSFALTFLKFARFLLLPVTYYVCLIALKRLKYLIILYTAY